MDHEIKTLTNYISAWGWYIISMIFLCSLVVLMATKSGLFGMVFSTAFFISFAYSTFMAHKRKKEVYNE